MKKLIGFMSLGLYSLAAVASPLIDDGIEAKMNEFPSVVKITSYQVKNKDVYAIGLCSGTLIAPDIVLTASHCVATRGDVFQQVSLAGDSKGNSDKGIQVVGSYTSTAHQTYSDIFQKNRALLNHPEYERLSSHEKSKIREELITSGALMQIYDIAFLKLEKGQVFAKGKPATLGCRSSLVPGAKVTIAGYGRKAGKNKDVDLNPNSVLNHGTSAIVSQATNGMTYTLLKTPGGQMTNFGDSGGPIFMKGNTSTVYGVVSTGYSEDGKTTRSDFANLSSVSAMRIYDLLLTDKKLPKSLRKILQGCTN